MTPEQIPSISQNSIQNRVDIFERCNPYSSAPVSNFCCGVYVKGAMVLIDLILDFSYNCWLNILRALKKIWFLFRVVQNA